MENKLLKNNFTDYLNHININKVKKSDIIYKKTNNILDISNYIIYGPSGSGKYTKALKIIKNYSKSKLKYQKKLLITSNSTKTEYTIKISDIHFEIDMELLGCNSKTLWYDIFNSIIDIINNNETHSGIILCKNFHFINNELLDIFYSYMQNNIFNSINIKFILLTQHISFIPKSIINISTIITSEKMSTNNYKKLYNIDKSCNIDELNNLKHLEITDKDYEIMVPYKSICDNIINIILDNTTIIDFVKLRKILYDILIYHLDINDCVFYILSQLIEKNKIDYHEENIKDLLDNTYLFFKYYNNNYRPIYHLENYILYLIKYIHEF